MNKNLRNTGLALLAAGALAYPAYRLYKYLSDRRSGEAEGEAEHTVKSFIPALKGKRHKNRTELDGHMAH